MLILDGVCAPGKQLVVVRIVEGRSAHPPC